MSTGLVPDNSTKNQYHPVMERLLEVFGGVTLPVQAVQRQDLGFETPSRGSPMKIVDFRGLTPAGYPGLAKNPD
jgi:hypothetical protein